MKMFKQMKKYGARIAAPVAGGLTLLAGAAHADVPATVSTALTGAGTDSVTVAGLVIAAIVGIFAFKLMRKALA